MASKAIFLKSFDPFPRTRQIVQPNSSSSCLRVRAHSQRWSGRVVDESMIVLRKRIHEMKMMEDGCDVPSEWMGWEKRVYESYGSIICDAMGHLQTYLMETRPSSALALLLLVALSVSTSTAVVMYNLLGLCSAVLSGIHLA